MKQAFEDIANDREILLTKDMSDETDGIRRIPYYRFIYDNSVSRDRKIAER